MRKYSPSKRNMFATDRNGFRQRQSAALQRRLRTAITGKMLAYEIGVHPDTVMNWVNGRVTMDGAAIEALDAFFSARAAPGFLAELYGRAATPTGAVHANFSSDRCLWFTGEGAIHEAPAGHAQFVRDILKISSAPQDLPAYAIRNLGWVECLVRSDGRIKLRYASTAADPAATARARDWLVSEGQNVMAVDLTIWRDRDWEHHSPATVSDAAAVLDRASLAGSFDRIAERDWTVEQLPLDKVKSPAIASLIAAVKQGAQVVETAASLRLMDTSALFGVEKNDVTSLWIGSKLLVPIKLFVNRNVLDRPDRNYAALIHHHVLEAVKKGPTFYRLDIEIMGQRRRYERVALPQGHNLVITSVKLLRQGVAA